jgi:hypothetical protein
MPQLHLYHLDDAPDLQSCSLLFRRNDPALMARTSAQLSKGRRDNFYGKKSPPRDASTLNRAREFDRLDNFEVVEEASNA